MDRPTGLPLDGVPPRSVGNTVLRLLPPDALRALCPHLERIPLSAGRVLFPAGAGLDHAYFPESGILSLLASFADGARIAVGMVGREGMVGLCLLHGFETAHLETLVQVDGAALRLPEPVFRAVALGPAFLRILLRYTDAYLTQVSQSGACNGRHSIEQRLSRWILMTEDRVGGGTFGMTQEFIAVMLGVRRSGVTQAIGTLQRAALVRHERGTLAVLDRPGLEAMSCECYRSVRVRNHWLLPDH